MPPRQAAAKAAQFALRMAKDRMRALKGRRRCSYVKTEGRLGRLTVGIAFSSLSANAETLRALTPQYCAHRFDLLGSGWVRVAHGMPAAGFGAWHYGPGAALPKDWRQGVADQAWPGNRARARALLDQIDDANYVPIDWHVDFKSGYRWSPRVWGPSASYGHLPGVDIKVPWELARMRHLLHLGLAYALDHDPAFPREFRHQVLDFLAANPPGWGVNWACAMDVSIRAATILMAREIFMAGGVVFDDRFEAELAAAMLAHGRHVVAHLEWNDSHRGNHYLANICGLAFMAAALPRTPETDAWLGFAVHGLTTEIDRQFTPDGANFEASTAYHRLSAEMAVFTAALILGLPKDKCAALSQYNPRHWPRRRPALPPAPASAVLPYPGLLRLARAAVFSAHITKPSGEIVQIGDCDSGRFVGAAPLFTPDLTERHLDHSALIAAASGLFDLGLPVLREAAIDRALVSALAGGNRRNVNIIADHNAGNGRAPDMTGARIERVRFVLPDSDALMGLQAFAYPDFGLYIWKGPRAFVSFRCGPIGQNGAGGHAHNDQLAVEIEIDGKSWTRDPGTHVYTPDLTERNRYRSALAHFVPRCGVAEPARFLAPFRLEDSAQARLICFDSKLISGWHGGFGAPIMRRLSLEDGALVMEDYLAHALGETEHVVRSPKELAALWELDLPFSAGYGL